MGNRMVSTGNLFTLGLVSDPIAYQYCGASSVYSMASSMTSGPAHTPSGTKVQPPGAFNSHRTARRGVAGPRNFLSEPFSSQNNLGHDPWRRIHFNGSPPSYLLTEQKQLELVLLHVL
jgi:hypothetical protein